MCSSSQEQRTNVLYHDSMDSATAPDRRAAAAERGDSSSFFGSEGYIGAARHGGHAARHRVLQLPVGARQHSLQVRFHRQN